MAGASEIWAPAWLRDLPALSSAEMVVRRKRKAAVIELLLYIVSIVAIALLYKVAVQEYVVHRQVRG